MRCVAVAGWLALVSSAFGHPPNLPVPTPDLVKALVAVLHDVDVEVRINAGNALAAIGAPAVDALVAALTDPNRETRASSAYALGQMGADAAPATAALVKALQDPVTDVRRQSAQALSRILLAQRQPPILAQPPVVTPPAGTIPPPVFPPEKPRP